MNDQAVPTMSRRQRHVEEAQQGHPKKNTNAKNHGGLVVILVLLSLFLLASAPVYGLMKNAPKMTKTTTSATSSSSSAASSSSSATATSQSQSAASSQSQSATSQAQQSSDDQAASQAASANTAVLATGQTLYNFAVTHGTTADQIYNLNPGVTAQNYTQYAGQSLKIK
ncbi:hypothetical protein FPFC_020330 [Fructobacillus pseudoficulneus]|uniref:LysM domain-containing protein n=1 Tax=Fructobacillus pseudoficulneus TaxID=220714 RepID=A0A3F3GSP4_9LACO|nr:LysM domain-containing protein [Fructobacillus pseudoficulneus]GAP02586.1 hypothetical protein FPFC_020330 [Fructobacillus pseudoficulneus]SEH38375.1 hypothetical protein SAMN05660469_0521 [Fructobacillus pseudoficulneus]